MSNQWFKFYGGEYLSDAKIGRLTASERSCWITLLSMASMTEDGVIKFLEVDDLLKKSGIHQNLQEEGDWEKCQNILQTLSSLKMIDVSIDGNDVKLINWEKRQIRTAQTPYERVKKYRQNKAKNRNDNEKITLDNENDNDRIEENRIEENRIHNNDADRPKRKNTKKEKLNTSGYSFKFESFWNAYPLKIAKGKAYDIFQLLSDDVQTTCVNAINKQVENNHFWFEFVNDGQGGDQPPHPSTWLNQKRWEDTIIKKERVGRNSQNNPKGNGVLKFT